MMLHKSVTGTDHVITLTHFRFHSCFGTQLFTGPHSTNEVVYLIYCQQHCTMLQKSVTGTDLVITLPFSQLFWYTATPEITLSVRLSICLLLCVPWHHQKLAFKYFRMMSYFQSLLHLDISRTFHIILQVGNILEACLVRVRSNWYTYYAGYHRIVLSKHSLLLNSQNSYSKTGISRLWYKNDT
jgi:hypothetical protein